MEKDYTEHAPEEIKGFFSIMNRSWITPASDSVRANTVVLHTDEKLLPKRKKAWASWNYQLSHDRTKAASVTYNMNILQGIESKHTFCVTLNQKDDIDPKEILREFTYHHPVFSANSIKAQQQRPIICGVNHTHFAGAYWHSGFHEDGVRSAVEVAERFDCYLGVHDEHA